MFNVLNVKPQFEKFPYYIVLLKQDEVQGVRVTLKKRFPYYIVLLKHHRRHVRTCVGWENPGFPYYIVLLKLVNTLAPKFDVSKDTVSILHSASET